MENIEAVAVIKDKTYCFSYVNLEGGFVLLARLVQFVHVHGLPVLYNPSSFTGFVQEPGVISLQRTKKEHAKKVHP